MTNRYYFISLQPRRARPRKSLKGLLQWEPVWLDWQLPLYLSADEDKFDLH